MAGMALISLHDIKLGFGGHRLFDGIKLNLEPGERLCLLGRNGEGKSTLMHLITGSIMPDSGSIARESDLRVAMLGQEVPAGSNTTIGDMVYSECDGLQEREVDATRVAQQLGLDLSADFATASGGIKRRALLARTLASHADIIMLDEPTNHLDLDTIAWLEAWLLSKVKTCIFVTHDRRFAERVANRIAEIDRGRLAVFNASFNQFMERREELYATELKQTALMDKKLAIEETWIRQGVKARRVRDEGRVKALIKLRDTVSMRRSKQGTAKLELASAAPSGDLVAELDKVGFAYGQGDAANQIIRNYSGLIMRGDRIGIVGPNGAGKTTLVKLIVGSLAPTSGSVRTGTKLEPIYFDQLRNQLDPAKTVAENLAGGDDSIMVNGKQKHINAYLKDFLFPPERARSPVSILSGGERNRLLLAKLFTRPSNILILDEPTNDLDLETMDLLEDLLLDYPGTILLVSHDRHFLDNVVTSLLVLQGDGSVEEFVGSHSDWITRTSGRAERGSERNGDSAQKNGSAKSGRPYEALVKPKKAGFREQRELAELPGKIAGLEAEIAAVLTLLEDPSFYKQPQTSIQQTLERQKNAEAALAQTWERWSELEALMGENP